MSAFSEANRKAFNDLSEAYNSKPWQRKLSSQVSDALQERKDWIGVQWATEDNKREVKLLDYACGTGAITKALGPYVTSMQGIDISEKMVEEYNKAALSSGLQPEQASAVVGDLFAEKVPDSLEGPRFQNFDVAVVGLGFHHFEDPALAVKRLVERLKPTGVLLLVDFVPFGEERKREEELRAQNPDADFPDMSRTIKHNGFERADMEKLFTNGGLEDFSWAVLDEQAVMELPKGTVHRTLFIARGRRPATVWGKLTTWFGGMQDQASGQVGSVMRADHGR
ncbi:hypothetical protein LTR36_000463 [Oleoguttula mirabilis]|uniref:Methyltransferase n=1 Tax=Oleoguttula mirabilis TaxID=1507867 RepID=A0AAV9JZ68_9PEZI|nr:hypothetical protein LTR36_000463 [Oleoguttula mirabilis]